jgi:asparagine synthase (glutamine-hydrolysing)
VHFSAEVDLRTFSIRAAPAGTVIDGLQICVAGYLSERAGPPPRSIERAATVAAAYRADPLRFSEALLGQFAVLVCDPAHRRVVLAQDVLGVRPLFYRLEAERLTVCTSLEAMASLTGLPDIDESYFAEMFAAGLPPFTRTPWKRTDRLSRGTVVVVADGEVRRHLPWSPPQRSEPAAKALGEEFLHLLYEAVDAAMPGSGNVWSELSGGLDSTTVVGIASNLRTPIPTLTLTNSMGLASPDQPFVSAAVRQYGNPSHLIDCDAVPPYSRLPDRFAGEPGSEFSVERSAAVANLLRRHEVDVLLTGSGGDIVFGGPDIEPHYLADFLVRGRWLALAREVREFERRHPDRRGLLHWLLHFAVRSTHRHWQGKTLKPTDPRDRLPAWLNFGWLSGKSSLDPNQWAPRVRLPGQQYFWQEIFAQTHVLWTPEQMAFPAEVRHPLYHLPLVEFMTALDPRERRGPDGDRHLQRRALAGILPEVVRTRTTKDGIQRQRETAFTRSPDWHRILLDRPRLVERGWVHPDSWQEEVERARIGMNVSGRSFDIACMIEAWLRSIETNAPPAAAPLSEPDQCGMT